MFTQNFIQLKKDINYILSTEKKTNTVKLLVVSKGQSCSKIAQLAKLGQRHFGENYIKESIEKINSIHYKLTWHFIGKIQSNKIKHIVKLFSWCHSIENIETAILLNKKRSINMIPLNVLIQININNESNKQGIMQYNLFKLSKNILALSNLKLRGIMVLPNYTKCYTEQLKNHYNIYTIFKKLQSDFKSIDTLSLGTSHDMKSAIVSGSTMIRIGHRIFNN